MSAGATPDAWAHWDMVLGLSEDLLPVVCEPGLTISPTSKLVSYGKVPSRFDRHGHVVGFPKWTEHRTTDAEIATWSSNPRLGICLQTRRVRAIDVDVEDAGLAAHILRSLQRAVPHIPLRRRANSAKFLGLIEVAGDYPKQTLPTTHGMIEFLGDGQQCLVAGTHPSGVPYTWDGGLPAAIPVVTPEALADLLSHLQRAYALSGADWSTPRATRKAAASDLGIPQADLDAFAAECLANDPVALWLTQYQWVVAHDRVNLALHITCPWRESHTSDNGDPTATSYFLADTGGFAKGHYRCLHAHCTQRTDADFLDAIGYADHLFLDGFAPLEDDYETLFYEADAHSVARTSGVDSPLAGPAFNRDIRSGTIKPLLQNVVLALGDPEFCGHRISRDEFRDVLLLDDRPFKDSDYTQLTLNLVNRKQGFGPISSEMMKQAVNYVSEQHAFDSAIQWLRGLPAWDGVERVTTFCSTYLGVTPSAYAQAVSRYWWTAHAGRVLVPGVQADIAIILISSQGTGKTSSIKAMVPHPDEYVELSLLDRDEDLSRAMRGKLIGEMAELRGLNSRDLESIKAWISRQREEWVPKYLEFSRTFPRRLVLVGTSNQEEFLADETGNRRFAPLLVGERQDRDGIARDRDQLWAEATVLFEQSGVLWQDAETLAKAEHSRFEIHDAWLETVREWLAEPGVQAEAPGACDFLRMDDVLKGALHLDVKFCKPYEQLRLGKILHQLGYRRGTKRVQGTPRKVWYKAVTPLLPRTEDDGVTF